MRARACAQLVLVRLGGRLDGDVDDRLGNVHGLQDHRFPLIRQGVAGGGILQAHRGDDVAGIGHLDLFPLVGVHLQQAADAFLDALAGVQHRAARRQLAGIDPYKGEMPHVGVGHQLEGQGRQGRLIRGRALHHFALGSHRVHRRDIQGRRQVIHHRVQQGLNAFILEGRAAQHRHQGQANGAPAQGPSHHLGVHRLIRQVALHDLFVHLRQGLQQQRLLLLGQFLVVRRDVRYLKTPSPWWLRRRSGRSC